MDAEREFEVFYAGCRDRLARQVTALTGDSAVEVVQEAMVRAWQRWPAVRRHEDPEAWVRKVAYRLAVSRWRKDRRLVLGGQEDRPYADDRLDAVGTTSALVAGLRALPVSQRQALVLHYVAGLSVEEVAREMGAPTGTAKSWLSRGRARLQGLLPGAGEGDALEVRGR